jgi:hypothetical protein
VRGGGDREEIFAGASQARSIVHSMELRETIRHPQATLEQRARLRHARSSLARMRERDEADRPLFLPSPEELIQQRIVWVADAYGPTQAERLVAGLHATGIDPMVGSTRASDLVQRLRADRSPLGQVFLGTIVPPGARGLNVTRAELPAGALLALPTITVMGGSLTVLAVGFLLDRESGLGVDRALRTEYRTQLDGVTAQGISYGLPIDLQRNAVTAARKQLRRSLAAWIQDRFPGAFGLQPGGELPAVELLTHRTDEALGSDAGREWPSSLMLEESSFWHHVKWPDIFMIEGRDQGEDRYALRLRARESAILPTPERAGEALDDDRWRQLVKRLNRGLEGTMPLWVATCLMRDYDSQLTAMRDIPAAVGIGPKETGRRLTEAQRQLAIASEARAVAADVARWRNPLHYARFFGDDWGYASPELESMGGEGPGPVRRPRWHEVTSNRCPESAKIVLKGEKRVRQRLLVESELLGVGAGLRVQRLTLTVAILALIVATAALVVTAVSLASM